MSSSLIVANWKMNLLASQVKELAQALLEASKAVDYEIVIAPAYPYLGLVADVIKAKQPTGWFLGAQDVSSFADGAYTGQVSAAMLHDFGCSYCLVGHSERRYHNQESDAQLTAKIKQLLGANIRPILCLGETLAQKEAGATFAVVTEQLRLALDDIPKEQLSGLVVAYEPVWAIGTGLAATSAEASAVHTHIRGELTGLLATEQGAAIPLLYGGSVKAANAKEFLAAPNIDGALVGGAALNIAQFSAIIG